MNNQFLIMEKLKDSLKGLDEATKNAEADRAALIMRIDELEGAVISLCQRVDALEDFMLNHTKVAVDHSTAIETISKYLFLHDKFSV